MSLVFRPAHELRDLLRRGEITARELVQAFLDRIEKVEPRVGSFLTVCGPSALAEAEAVDAAATGNGAAFSELAGIPVALKDNLSTAQVRTTCASRFLENYVPPYDATVVTRLRQAGLPILGKTNMDEFAMGSSTENSAFQITRNPWHLGRVPGGSSGGSAAAVAAHEVPWALGSDTGGSIRQPAAFCGVVGLKPTYGRVSRFGLVAFASSLDQVGTLTKDVRDAALLLGIISGHDPADSTSVQEPVPDYTAVLGRAIKGLRIGLPREYFVPGMDPEVEQAVREAVRVLEGLGAHVDEVSLPHSEYALATYYLIATSEASSNLARYDGVRYGYRSKLARDSVEMFENSRGEAFGPEVKRRILMGTYALSAGYYDAYYLKALKVRTLIRRDFETAFQRFDLLAAPTTPTTAFALGERLEDPLQMYLSDVCTLPANLAGIPALSIPCGLSQDGLPIGFQLMGRPFDEATLLQVAYAYEQAVDARRWRLGEEVGAGGR